MLLVFTQGSLIITSDVIDDIIIDVINDINDISACYDFTSQTHFNYISSSLFSFIYCVQ